ncbi:DUF4118 domain-containing protein [Pseudonocardia sp. NPDC049154]|uniref:DUF4118 domain-containing protein n=1 Tax=Pseudonocardia sp. NPDC049154 TaxID=3155501 RepID=UPI00340AF1C0
MISAVVAAASFDLFLTAPYYHFTIRSPSDVETGALLLVVGIVVNELAQWGRRELEHASAREASLARLTTAARMRATGQARRCGLPRLRDHPVSRPATQPHIRSGVYVVTRRASAPRDGEPTPDGPQVLRNDRSSKCRRHCCDASGLGQLK